MSVAAIQIRNQKPTKHNPPEYYRASYKKQSNLYRCIIRAE